MKERDEKKKIQRKGLLFKLYQVKRTMLAGFDVVVIYLDLMNIVWIYWKKNEEILEFL